MNRALLYSLGGLAALGVSFAAGRFTVPTRVETKVEVVERVRVVRLVQVQRTTDVKWKTVVVTRTDGTSTTTTEAESHENEKIAESTKSTSDTKSESKTLTVSGDKNWHVTLLGGVNLVTAVNGGGLRNPVFAAQVSRRILGPAWLTVQGQSDGVFMVGAGVSF